MRYEEEVKDSRYRRLQWHGGGANSVVKSGFNVDEVIETKTRFCNFVYSNRVPFREKFFAELSKYKRVDAPGISMNNMAGIDSGNGNSGDRWQRKRAFISQYKFTIAFENSSYPGYHTEKLLDPMMVGSLPIYWGNPSIDRHFNPNSFVNAHEQLKANGSRVVEFLDANCQREFAADPDREGALNAKVTHRLKRVGQAVKTRLQYDANFARLIERVIDIERADSLYARYMSEPWFHNNMPPSNDAVIQRWREIFG